MRSASAVLLALAASLSTTSAALQGFNYGATKSDGSYNFQSDYQALFSTAKNLVGTSGFTSARLYTMIVRLDATPPLNVNKHRP
jgi:glucan endo-1,3-beta-D-glucosidase